jgi:hypothetical protein
LDGGEVGGGCGVGCVALEDDGGEPVALDIQIKTPARPEGALSIEIRPAPRGWIAKRRSAKIR